MSRAWTGGEITQLTPTRARKPNAKNWKQQFLVVFAETGTITHACEAVGVARKTVYNARQKDEAFGLAFADADEAVTEGLERECIRRALEGSDRLLEFILKARRPEKYSEQHRLVHSADRAVKSTPLTPEQERAELIAFGMPAALNVAAGPDSVPAPEDA